jgi:hypothetical protein
MEMVDRLQQRVRLAHDVEQAVVDSLRGWFGFGPDWPGCWPAEKSELVGEIPTSLSLSAISWCRASPIKST